MDADRQVARAQANIIAARMTIRACEGTAGANGYRYLFGSLPKRELLFESFVDHPRFRTYERGDEFIQNGRIDYTTAAGAYQITETTFDRLRRKRPGKWRGFGPQEQDEMCEELIFECRALEDAAAGRLAEFVDKCGPIWASLPSSRSDQPRRTMQFAVNAFAGAGGIVT